LFVTWRESSDSDDFRIFTQSLKQDFGHINAERLALVRSYRLYFLATTVSNLAEVLSHTSQLTEILTITGMGTLNLNLL
jgi:hypothetical protein